MPDIINDPHARRFRILGTGLAVTVYMFLWAPIVVTVPMAFGPTNALAFPPTYYSFDLFGIFFNSPEWLRPLFESLKVALGSTALAMLAGVPAGYWIARHEFVGKGLITSILMSPLVVPAVVAALGLFLYFSYLKITATTLSLVLGHVMVTLPYVVLMIMAGVHKLDRNLEFGAELMGAKPIRMFLTVVLPQLVPSLVSAAFFAFLLSFDEVIISWFLAGSNTITLPVKMFTALEFEVSPVIAAVSSLLTALSLLVCIVVIAFKKAMPIDG
ncbi:ABC transporter permease [Bradyrhizobium sp. ISRA443]|uniref:ABC transporter permease n=1 Tax=unclassified Bradyrhizobium TaxID=2631580 RepID=UPI002478DF8E|nr:MULTISPECIES: ABC transporter permease [unclassified Bradyrhizobium]WGR93428.1 ABC transporter permease [Bradyrhizobium sp. ISRA435]WGR97971.1 ABC transporter permease [Bradyrhizobium sp. ISRA436]WGS04861.1 ABC transporter permease [Bradyrhizobium sp. ISRA437]WGS11742.1 ABC transporter permease [Bradyrhizobium sp. ISRA443]